MFCILTRGLSNAVLSLRMEIDLVEWTDTDNFINFAEVHMRVNYKTYPL